MEFKIRNHSTSDKARTGCITTAHGKIKTPVFMPVGTLGTVKSLSPEELDQMGVQVLLGNTYHLYLRPGCEVIEKFSGLHRFMNWHKPILTDSGGFQVFSLAKLAKISDQGAAFQSHIDGSRHLLTPEKSLDIQMCLNSDIVMCLDQCIHYPATYAETEKALEITTKWAKRCQSHWKNQSIPQNALFGIVQGGMYKDLRARSANELGEIDFDGYAVGGISVGEPKEMMLEISDMTLSLLAENRPRYVMGVGTPENLVELVAMGADMFDCVLPTRNARNGQLFTQNGTLNIANARHTHDSNPVDECCSCYTCRKYSRAYLRHLYMSRELLAYRLNTIHNVYYYTSLMEQVRTAINENTFDEFKKNFYNRRNVK